jgi:hypothetical protein
VRSAFLLAGLLLASAARAETVEAGPADYRAKMKGLRPGETLRLAPGDYRDRLNISGLHGTPDAWIVIRGPARFLGDPRGENNTIEIRSGSYVALEDLVIDGQGVEGIFGISAAGTDTHHIRIEGCTIVGHGANQQTVAISTKTETWGWILRRNRIVGAGTGCYLGNSDGSDPFIGGLIEYNLFEDSRGYNVQIKHQTSRDAPGAPATPQRTILRHNVFLKTNTLGADSGARPNLLLGAFPREGRGSEDSYEVYGNLFLGNREESLLQAEGRVSIHDNIFVDCAEDAVRLADHNDRLRRAYVCHNTFYSVRRAIHFADAPREDHLVAGNLMFSDSGISGACTRAEGNLHVPVAKAGEYVRNPGEMDFYPLPGRCRGEPVPPVAGDDEGDFNGNPKGDRSFRGAYSGEGENPGWRLARAIKGG